MRVRLLALPFLLAACGGGGGGAPPAGANLAVFAAAVDFGPSEVGRTATAQLVVRNPQGGTATRITALERSSDRIAFGADLPALPHALAPGEVLSVTVRWTPAGEGFLSESILVRAENRAPVVATVSGRGFLPFEFETVIELGAQPVSAVDRETPDLTFDVPDDAISFTIEATGSRTSPTGGPIFLVELTGPGGEVYVDPADPHAGPYVFERNFPSRLQLPRVPVDLATLPFPNSDRPDAQLAPGGGTYRFRLSNEGGSLASLRVRVFVERRAGGIVDEGRIPLNVFLSPSLLATAQSAPTDPHVQTILARADELLGLAGAGLGDVDYYKLSDPRYDTADPRDVGPIVEQSAMAAEVRVNVFLVKTVLFGAAGVSAGIPGPKLNGTRMSGVVVLGDEFFHPEDLGTVLAHEICHHLGLGHTFEQPGATPWGFDLIDDTCPGPGCVDDPALNLMIPTALPPGPPVLTPGQAHVLLRNPLVEAGSPTFTPGAVFQGVAQRAAFSCANCGE